MTLSNTERILIYCLSHRKTCPEIKNPEQLTVNQWNEVFDLSKKHSVTQILYRIIRDNPEIHAPEEIMKRLRAYYLAAVEHNMMIYHNLAKVLNTLKNENIPVIALKGAYLNETVYGNIAARSMSDIDLLVKKKDLPKAQKALQNAGLLSDTKTILLDLHCEITHDLNMDIEGIWGRSERAEVAGCEILVLSPADMLVTTCIHLSYHHMFQFSGLRSVNDIKAIIDFYRERMNWNEVIERSLEWGVGNSIYLSLVLVRDLLGADIPENCLKNLKPADFTADKKQWALKQILSTEKEEERNLSQYFWKLFTDKPLREKLKSLQHLVTPSPESMSQRYHTISGTFTNYLRYFTRLKQNFPDYAKAFCRMLRKDEKARQRLEAEKRTIEMKEWLKF